MASKGKITKSAGLISIATFISRVLGYIKDMILAKFFGATVLSDVFFVAFRIPNLLRELLAEGSISSAFVPVLTECQTKQGKDEANHLVKSVFFFILIVGGIISIAGIIFAPFIVSTIAPGFLSNLQKFNDTVLLTRIMFPFLLFISMSALVMGSLNTRGVFFIPAAAPAILNIVTIICVITLIWQFTNPIISVAIGVTIGGLAQFLFQVPLFFKQGYRLNLNRPLWHPGLKKIGLLIIPSTVALAVAQINIFASTILASYLEDGSITYLYYAMRLIQFPIGIFGVAMGMAVLPILSEHSAKKDLPAVKEDFSYALRLLFFITVPAMIGLIALKIPIVNTLFQRGEFTYSATVYTAEALMFYSIGIWAIVGTRTVSVTFYSLQDTKTPVKVAIFGIVLNIILSLLLMLPLKHNGLALSNSLAASANFLILFYLLMKRLGGVEIKKISLSFIKTLMASILIGITGLYLSTSSIWTTSNKGIEKGFYLFVIILFCVIIFVGASYILRNEELKYLMNKIKRHK